MEEQKRAVIVLALFALLSCLVVPSQLHAEDEIGQWINHLDFLPGSDVDTKFDIVSVRGGGLAITPAAATPLSSFVQQGLQVPAGYLVNGVRVCYAQTGDSYIDRVTLLQLQDPPTGVDSVLDDKITFNGTDSGPVCMNTDTAAQRVPVDPSLGALNLRFGVNFTGDTDSIVILGVGLLTVPDPNSPVSQLQEDVEQLNSNQERIINVLNEHGADVDDLERNLDRLTNAVINHTHIYTTGKGTGHNNVDATTSTLYLGYEMPAPKDQAPEKVEKDPVKVEEVPVKVEEAPAKVEKAPVKVEKAPVKVEETPVKVEEKTTPLTKRFKRDARLD